MESLSRLIVLNLQKYDGEFPVEEEGFGC